MGGKTALVSEPVTITSPDKVMFLERNETKADLADYYRAVQDPLLKAIGGRPLLLQRYPNGAHGQSFFQKRVPDKRPDWLQTTVVSTPNGTTSDALVAADIEHILWAVNLGSLGFHVWPFRSSKPDVADELRIDLDPSPGVDFEMLREGAHEVKALLDELGIAAFPKTTGSRGIHIYVHAGGDLDSYQVRSCAVALARELERRRPDLMTWQWWKEERGERVFIDYNQNCPHKTIFGAWGVRANDDARVSAPFFWDELPTVDIHALNLATVPDRLRTLGDPWAETYANPQSLQPLLEMNDKDTANGLMDAPWPPVYPKQPNEPPRVAPSRAKKT
ncbi:MAG: non-homologous end-joining DNA ligase [Acidimicrobiales bacterium]|nr:non-homologous end-joining DNA ligase [Acidimicrobiales bacterium]